MLILCGGMSSSIHASLGSRPKDYTVEKREFFERLAGKRVPELDAMSLIELTTKLRKVKDDQEKRLLIAALGTRKPSTEKEVKVLFDVMNRMVIPAFDSDEDNGGRAARASAETILRCTDLRLAPAVIKHINHGNNMARMTAIRWVTWNNVRDAVPELIDSVKDGSAREEKLNPGRFEVRDAAVEALGKFGDERAIPALMRALKWTPSASIALSQFGMKVAPDLVKLYKSISYSPVSNYQSNVAYTFKFMRDKTAIPLMWKLLNGDDTAFKEDTAAMLENTCDATTTPTLSEVDERIVTLYLKNRWFSDLVVNIAVRTNRIDLLVKVIGENNTRSDIRREASKGLIKLKAVSAVPELEKLYKESPPYSSKRVELSNALKGITGKDY